MILFVFFLGANLFIISIYQKINQAEISGEEKDEINEIIQQTKTEIDDQFIKSNQTVENIKKRIPFWEYLDQINQFLPEGVFLTRVAIDESAIKIEGVADGRNNLVEFKNSLESVDFFKEVNMPISNLTSQEDINFEIGISLSATKNQ